MNDVVTFVIFFILWILLQKYILPGVGVST